VAKFLVENSGPLKGEVSVSGSKNAVLPIMAATLLTDEECEILDAPDLRDVDVMCKILRSIGATVVTDFDNDRVSIEVKEIKTNETPAELVQLMRASIVTMGPLLARTGRAKMPLPGGCTIGARPIDLHLKGFEQMGAKIVRTDTYVEVIADRLQGARIYLDYPSVGATENIMLAAALAEGPTIIENVAQEPEIVDLANFLNKMGASIRGAGTAAIRIKGREKLHGTTHAVIPDRIETGTFMVAAAITRGDVLIKNTVSDHVRPIIAKLKECGAEVYESDEGIRVNAVDKNLVPTDIKTMPYPGFPTDMQSQFMALLTTIEGSSTVIETVFENRYMHVSELVHMGADIKVDGKRALVTGTKRLHAADVMATDLRAGAALVLAAMTADGVSEITEIYHIERGYSQLAEKLRGLGAKIVRVD